VATSADLGLRPESIGETIYLLRRRSALPKETVAELADVPLATYSRYENDSTRNGVHDLTSLRRILRVLATSLELDEAVLWTEIFQIVDRANAVKFSASAEIGGIGSSA